MREAAKILARAHARATISFREFEQLLGAFGFQLVRTRGSHRIYRNDGIGQILPIQPDGKDAKPYQIRMLLKVARDFDLRLEERE